MLRLLGFFALVLAALLVLRELPFVGGLFRIPLVGFYLAAIVVSGLLAWWGRWALDRARFRALERELGRTDTPRNRGKLGTLLLHQGRARAAAEHLAAASAGDPAEPEWDYRLGIALLAARRPAEAVEALERTVARSEEYAYGAALLRLAEALTALGRSADALAALERHERAYGETPEGLYRRGRAERAAGRRVEAARSFARVPQLVPGAARYQRAQARGWALRALLARLAP